MDYQQRLDEVEARIRAACVRAGRIRESVELIAVSKTKPVEMIEGFYNCGQHSFGENRPQELRDKYDLCPVDISWHMIGNLQKNKIKYVLGRAILIHSVDSQELAEAIEREAARRDLAADVLLEVNLAGEKSKSGARAEEASSLARFAATLPHLHVRGLMTVAPFVEDPEENRPVFRALRELSVDIARQNIDNVSMNVLSMGMTNDYEIAIEEGATCIRVGTALFGAREHTNPR